MRKRRLTIRKQLLTAVALLLCVCLLSPAGVSLAEAPAAEAVPQEETLNLFGNGTAAVYAPEGKLTFLEGCCTDQPVKSVEDAAAVVETILPSAGGNEKTHFEPWRTLTDPAGNIYYVFQQVYADTTVPGGAVKVITDAEGTMIGLTCSVVSDLPETEEAEGITREAAEACVTEHETQSAGEAPEILKDLTQKIILPVNLEPDLEEEMERSRFVWAIYTPNPNAGVSSSGTTEMPYLAHYVSMEGEYLYSLPTLLPGDAASLTGSDANYVFEFMEPVDYTGFVDFSDGTEHEITMTVMRDTRTGMYYLGNIERKIVVADCWNFLYNHGTVILEFSPDNREWDQTCLLALYNYCRAYDYYKEIGWLSGDGEETPIIILKDFCDEDHKPMNNAAYAGKYYGWQCFLSSPANDYAQCLDVSAHEYTHSVTHTVMTCSFYQNDFGAINEAMSDIQGNICEMMAGATEDTEWLLGETGMNTVRSMSDPQRYQQPAYTWDLYYMGSVKTPTLINDEGGVHINSSLLSNVAYRLCAEGGMTLEEARIFWFAADCAMTPGTDFPQLRVLLPFVLKAVGMERYQEALQNAMEATRLGEDQIPDPLDGDRAMLVLNLPDQEPFNDGNWLLSVFSVNVDLLTREGETILEAIRTENMENLPPALAGRLMHPEQEVTEDEREEIREWLRSTLQEGIFSGNGSAGQDGHTVRMMAGPGYALPTLLNIRFKPNSYQVEEAHLLLYLSGRWYDVGSLLPEPGAEDFDLAAFFESGPWEVVLPGLVALIFKQTTVTELLKSWCFEIKGGEILEIPADGLETLNPDRNLAWLYETELTEEEPEHRMSRPIIP